MRQRRADRADQYTSRTYREALGRIAANVRRLRDALGWSQERAAEACEMATRQFQCVEAASANLTTTTLARLADGFEVDLRELFAPAPAPVKRSRGRPLRPQRRK